MGPRTLLPLLTLALAACGGAPFTTEGAAPWAPDTATDAGFPMTLSTPDPATPTTASAPDASPAPLLATDAGPVDMAPQVDAAPAPEASIIAPDAAPGICCFVRGGIAYPCGTAITSCPDFGQCSEGGSLGTRGACPMGAN